MDDLDQILQRIAALQSSGTPAYRAGLFPNWRRHPALPYRRLDTNIFCTALVVFTLQPLRHRLSADSQALLDSLIERAVATYPFYRNTAGKPTYNNYETRPGGQFRNGYIFHHFSHFRLPDDIDDTALIYLTKPHSSAEIQALKDLLPRHANGAMRWIRNTPAEYRSLRAYSTWFGVRMGIDFDVCALCNLFLLLLKEGLELNENDEASLSFIGQVLRSGDYHKRPFDVSHHYPRPALIFYHATRLLAAHDPIQLAGCRDRLRADGPALLAEELSFFDRVLVSTALLKLGEKPPVLQRPATFEAELAQYPFFIGCMLTPYERPAFLYRWAHHPLTHFQWVCPAHSLALWAEYLAWSQETTS